MRHIWNRGSRHEVSTVGRDPSLQLVKGDPYGTLTFMGLPVPLVQPSTVSPNTRYLFLLASAQFNANHVARLVGMRQYVTIGTLAGGYPIEFPITTPSWHFQDGNVSWHLRRYELQPNSNQNADNKSGLSYLNSGTPALIYATAPDSPGGYSAPQPPGNVVVPDLGNFHDIRFKWQDDRAWDSLDIEIEGPCTIALFASIQQTNATTRPVLTFPTPPPGGFGSINPEDGFLLNFPTAVYTRVAGALIFEDVPMLRDYSNPQPWDSPSNHCESGDQVPKRPGYFGRPGRFSGRYPGRPGHGLYPVRPIDPGEPKKNGDT